MPYECTETIYRKHQADHSIAVKLSRRVAEELEGDVFPWTAPCIEARVRPGGGRMIHCFAKSYRSDAIDGNTKEDADALMAAMTGALTSLGIDTDQMQLSVTVYDHRPEMLVCAELKSQAWEIDKCLV